jgi:hypothetical protein
MPDLIQAFPNCEIRYQQPWHHNRHMVILRGGEGEGEDSALYFARHHRMPYVTPVLIRDRGDIDMLETTFENRWESAPPLHPPRTSA